MCRIAGLRTQIDVIDQELVKLLGRRLKLAAEIGTIKAETGLPIYDFSREREVHENIRRACRKTKILLEEDALDIFQAILKSSLSAQMRRGGEHHAF
jgi:chorismate mutase